MTAPCKGCERRHIGCHSMCRAFQEWKKKIAETAELKQKHEAGMPVLCKRVIRQIWREMKWK